MPPLCDRFLNCACFKDGKKYQPNKRSPEPIERERSHDSHRRCCYILSAVNIALVIIIIIYAVCVPQNKYTYKQIGLGQHHFCLPCGSLGESDKTLKRLFWMYSEEGEWGCCIKEFEDLEIMLHMFVRTRLKKTQNVSQHKIPHSYAHLQLDVTSFEDLEMNNIPGDLPWKDTSDAQRKILVTNNGKALSVRQEGRYFIYSHLHLEPSLSDTEIKHSIFRLKPDQTRQLLFEAYSAAPNQTNTKTNKFLGGITALGQNDRVYVHMACPRNLVCPQLENIFGLHKL